MRGMFQLNKRLYVNATAATSTSAITVSVTTSAANANISTVTTISTMPKGMKLEFSRIIEGKGQLSQNTPSLGRLSKGRISNTLGKVWCAKL